MSTFDADPLQSGDAFIRHEQHAGLDRWTIGNGAIACAIGWLDDRILQIESIERIDTLGVMARASRELFALTLDDTHRLTAETTRVTGVETGKGPDWVRLRISLASEDHGEIVFALECHAGHAVLRQWLEYTPSDGATITGCDGIVLELANPDEHVLRTVAGVQQQGGWSPGSGVYRSFRLEERDPTEAFVVESGLRSTWDECPWAAVTPKDETDGLPGGLLMAFDYGGQWELAVHPEPSRDAFTLAFAPVQHEPVLKGGSPWRSPATWVGIFPDDLDAGTRIWVDYLRAHVIPEQPEHFPWVQYNTWYSYFCDLDAGTLLEEARIAADLGVEVFYVDAGWWVGNPRRRDNFASGLGNWRENTDKFPGGIRAFADRIRDLGMHFGIWVEPERVDIRTATTGTWRTDWIATANGDYLGPEWPRDTDTAWLCYGHPEVQAWATAWIGDMVEEFGVRWLKWDSNYWGVCTNPAHGHGTGDGERAQLEGVYAVMDALRARHPGLVIENCAGGGTRMDFAIARHTHTWWLDDASEPAHRTRMHSSGAGYLFPLETLNSWVTESSYENLNGQDLPDPVVRAIFRSRMLGAIGISCRTTTWSPAVRDIVREELSFYTEHLRPLVREGYLLHLLPQPDLHNPRIAPAPSWEAFGLQSAGGATTVVLGFRNRSIDDTQRVFLKGLDPAAAYTVTGEDGSATSVSGDDLMTIGYELACAPLCSTLVRITQSG